MAWSKETRIRKLMADVEWEGSIPAFLDWLRYHLKYIPETPVIDAYTPRSATKGYYIDGQVDPNNMAFFQQRQRGVIALKALLAYQKDGEPW